MGDEVTDGDFEEAVRSAEQVLEEREATTELTGGGGPAIWPVGRVMINTSLPPRDAPTPATDMPPRERGFGARRPRKKKSAKKAAKQAKKASAPSATRSESPSPQTPHAGAGASDVPSPSTAADPPPPRARSPVIDALRVRVTFLRAFLFFGVIFGLAWFGGSTFVETVALRRELADVRSVRQQCTTDLVRESENTRQCRAAVSAAAIAAGVPDPAPPPPPRAAIRDPRVTAQTGAVHYHLLEVPEDPPLRQHEASTPGEPVYVDVDVM